MERIIILEILLFVVFFLLSYAIYNVDLDFNGMGRYWNGLIIIILTFPFLLGMIYLEYRRREK